MAQFDYILIFPLLWSLILILFLNYKLIIMLLLPQFCSLLKFKKKLLILSKFNIMLLNKISNY